MGRTPIVGLADPYDAKQRECNRAFLRVHPVCCMPGCFKRSRHADHIQTVRSAPERRFDWANLQPLCQRHHAKLTRAFDYGDLRGACDVDGNPLDPDHPWLQPDTAAAIAVVNAPRQQADPVLAAHLKRRFIRERTSR